MNKKIIVMFVGAIVVVGIVSFYIGNMTSRSTQSVSSQNTSFQNGGNLGGRGDMRGGNNFTGGTVISKDSQSMTVQGRDGSSKIIFFTANTPVMKMVAGTASDIVIGKDISITGTPNPDGSISALSIQIRQSFTNPTQK